MDMLTEYQHETAALANGIIDGVERLQRLRDSLDLTDPDWAFDVAEVTPSHTTLTIRPKDAEAPNRRPIAAMLRVDAEPGSELAEAIDNFIALPA